MTHENLEIKMQRKGEKKEDSHEAMRNRNLIEIENRTKFQDLVRGSSHAPKTSLKDMPQLAKRCR